MKQDLTHTQMQTLLERFEPSVRRQVEADFQAAELLVEGMALLARAARRLVRALTPTARSATSGA